MVSLFLIPLRHLAVLAAVIALSACTPPPRPPVQPGEQGLALDLTSQNRGQCALTGPNLRVRQDVVLGGDYFTANGDLLRSTLSCTLPGGQRVATTSHRQLFDTGDFNFAALIVSVIEGPGDVRVYGYSDGARGRQDTDGFFVFDPF